MWQVSFCWLGMVMSIHAIPEAASTHPDPVADPAAIVTAGNARFTVLTPSMIRMEWSPTGRFEDRASLAFINRRMPVPETRTRRDGDGLVLQTDALTLRYQPESGRFSPANLSVELNVSGRTVVWRPGTENTGNLFGTTRTLDTVSGATALEPGLLSRDGWVVVDDSKRPLFDHPPDGTWPWAVAREEPDAVDWYFFGYGHDYPRVLRDFTRVAGRIPVPPRFAFGSWWSRYWAYSDRELRELVTDFREHDVPLDVLVIDMDWHLDGWTGYTWNPKYFPDPEGFLKWVHEQGLRVTLNLHPHDGVKKHEAAFRDVCEFLGLDPDATEQVPFDCTDRNYVEAYFKFLHHPLERQGVDFWWLDWQQSKATRIKGLDPLWWLNYLHWTDMERNPQRGGRRPLLFSRWGGLGNHRFQIGFSGDAYSNWASLAFQPYFTSTAGNVGFGYWSHDIGGHLPGPVEPELYARWIQWGAFSPALRTHATKNPRAERRIWKFPDDVFRAAREAFHLRYALIPYIYAAARQGYDTGLPLCRPLYYEWPELEEAYRYTGEYLFGDQLLVAPVVKPVSPVSACAQVTVWIPPGDWTNWFTGRTYTGPAEVALLVPLDETPVFARSGAIIPMQPKMQHTSEKPIDPLILHVWPGDSGQIRVYEDDGESVGYQKGECAWTPVSHELVDGVRQVTIGPAEGSFRGMLEERTYEIHLRDAPPAKEVHLNGQLLEPARTPDATGWWYDGDAFSLIIRPARDSVRKKTSIAVRLAESEPALRDGLRGRLALVQRIGQLLDAQGSADAEPAAVTKLKACNADLVSRPKGPDWPIGAEKVIQEAARSFLEVIPQLRLDPSSAQQAVARLLGISADIRAAASGEKVGELRVVANLSLAPCAIKPVTATGRLTLSIPAPWQAQGKPTWEQATTLTDKPVALSTVLTAQGAPQTGVLKGDLAIVTQDGAHVDFPLETVLLPSVNRWWVVGPFDAPAPPQGGLDTVFPPEKQLDLNATYKGKDGREIGWQKVERVLGPQTDLTDEFRVEWHKVFGGSTTDAIAYALTYLHAPDDMDVTLACGTDDGVVIWLNGREIHRNNAWRPYESKQDRVPARLKKGTNLLLLKVSQGSGGWEFSVHVETPDGRPIPEVQALLTP